MGTDKDDAVLLAAAEGGDLTKVRELVGNAPHPTALNCRGVRGDTPLILAAGNGHDEVVRFLLNEGADVSALNQAGDDALIAAAGRPNNMTILELLVNAGAEVNHRNTMGRTALIEAASIGDASNVICLLQYRPDIDVVTNEEETALTFAVVNECSDVVKALIDAGANAHWKDTKGWTAFTYAAQSGNEEIRRLLAKDVSSNS